MLNDSIASLSDRDLLDATAHAVDIESRTTAQLVALLAEVDARKLYLGEGYASLFTYVTQALHLSESAAYSRITAARTSRRYPRVLAGLADGTLTLTAVGLLSAHLTDDNYESLLDAVRHKSKRDVERLVACLHPQPDIASSVRRLATPPGSLRAVNVSTSTSIEAASDSRPSSSMATQAVPAPVEAARPGVAARASLVAPIAADRYLLRVTLSHDAHHKLERARGLLRHCVPSGDPAAVIERALTALVEQLERQRLAVVTRPREGGRRGRPSSATRTRDVPASVRRAVWTRDDGRCAFVGTCGRCTERHFLEFHHVTPFAAGGATDASNLQLRCRAHNAYEALLDFGDSRQTEAHR
jgi:hypothetical protein